MTTGAYQDAVKAFTNADSVEITVESLYQRSRCFVALGKPKEALEALEEVLQLLQRQN
jgi:tetratricopeptide (TPR) repeat protein